MTLADRHVVVVGAGFAGLQAAKRLGRAGVRVTVVDRNNFHTFQPLLYQVATAGLGADDIAHNVRGIFHGEPNVDFHLGTVTGIDTAGRRALLTDGPDLHYDAVAVAAGASTATYGVPGADDHALPLKTLQEALAVRNHLLRRFEE